MPPGLTMSAQTAHPRIAILLRVVVLAALTAPLPAAAVIGGTADMDGRFPGVGSVTRVDDTGKVLGIFSGVLIGPDLALTAAHVVCGSAACDPVESGYRFNLNLDSGPVTFSIAEIVVHDGFTGFAPGSDGLIHNDLALLRLTARAPVAGYPIAPMSLGDEITLVGHGVFGPFGGPVQGANATLHHYGTNVFDRAIAPDVYAFDVTNDGASGVQLAGGDSGGPAFVRVGGEYFLAGINTFVFTAQRRAAAGREPFNGGGGMLLAAYAPWLQQVSGVPEPDAWLLFATGLALLVLVKRRGG